MALSRRHSTTALARRAVARRWLLLMVVVPGAWTVLDPQAGCAQGTVYFNRLAFVAALQSSTTATFESLPPSSPASTGTSSITDSGLTITSADHRLFVCNSSTGLYPIAGTGQYLWNFDSSHSLGVAVPGGMNAFAADFSGGIVPQNNPFTATLTVSLVGGQNYTYNFSGQAGAWGFRGFVFSSPISSLVYDDGGPFLPGAHEEMLDNVTYGLAVPEPGFSVLAVSAIALFQLGRKCRPTL